MSTGNVTFTIALPMWQTLVRAAKARGITANEFVASALFHELQRPQPHSWEEGCAAVSAAAQERQDMHELSVIHTPWPPAIRMPRRETSP